MQKLKGRLLFDKSCSTLERPSHDKQLATNRTCLYSHQRFHQLFCVGKGLNMHKRIGDFCNFFNALQGDKTIVDVLTTENLIYLYLLFIFPWCRDIVKRIGSRGLHVVTAVKRKLIINIKSWYYCVSRSHSSCVKWVIPGKNPSPHPPPPPDEWQDFFFTPPSFGFPDQLDPLLPPELLL